MANLRAVLIAIFILNYIICSNSISEFAFRRPSIPKFPAGSLPDSLAPTFPSRGGTSDIDSNIHSEDVNYNWTVSYFEQTIDHFSFRKEGSQKFRQKYLINADSWGGGVLGAPIFVYFGNEGPVDWFAVNTGFLWEIAPDFEALLVFPEHRYYGESMPFGSKEAAYNDSDSLAYLTAEQSMADMAVLITDLKRNLTAEDCPVIFFGGSYGGMLAAWFRLKYPHIALAALASSAPILQFEDVVPIDIFYNIVSNDFRKESNDCFNYIRDSWSVINEISAQDNGLDLLTSTFHLCKPLKDTSKLVAWLDDAYSYLAMVDYPIPANFLMPLPAYPIREVCRRIDSLPHDAHLLQRIFAGVSVYYNYTGQTECFDLNDDPHGMNGWNFQACTEMVMPMSSNANSSMFPPSEWNATAYVEWCQSQFGVSPRPSWILTQFGGKNITHVLKIFGSNIIFSNGLLDPWSGGSVLEDISDSIVALVIPDGAHHLDLRSATLGDPLSVIEQRMKERAYLRRWLLDFYETRGTTPWGGDASTSFSTMVIFTLVFLALMGVAVVGLLVLRSFYKKRVEEWEESNYRLAYKALRHGP